MANDYKQAYKKAPLEVKEMIKKYRRMPSSYKSQHPLLYFILNSGTPPYKMSKRDSRYTDKSKRIGEECINCRFAYWQPLRKHLICSQIRGTIKAPGWCKLWLQ